MKRSGRRAFGAFVAACTLVGGAAVLLTGSSASALTTITVANNANSGAGSLRQAFIDASNGGSAQSDDVLIVIPASVGNISLTSGELLYDGGDTGSHALTLQGGGNTITQTTANNRVIHDTANSLFTMSGLVITGGHAPAAQAGGGIFVQGAATISSSSITGNTAPDSAGGIRVSNGDLHLTNSTLSGNTATTGGAGGAFVNGNAIVTGSTISGNNAGGTGGGLYGNGTITLTNSTVTGNMSSNVAGGVRSDGGTITLIYSTVAGNTGGGAANVQFGAGGFTLISFGSVVALPNTGPNCNNLSGTTSNGYNWDDDGTCGFGAGPGDHNDAGNPLLGALGPNGGPTQTMLPQTGSPLIDAIPLAACQLDGAAGITTDQRGLARPSGAGCEIGAVEIQIPVLTALFTG